MSGSQLTAIAALLVLYLTRSPRDAGWWVAFAATAHSILVYMPAGALIDR